MTRWRTVAAFGFGGLGLVALLAASTACLSSGCASIGYYAQAAAGHLQIVRAAKPVDAWLADPATPPALKERLALTQRMRDFAVTELALPDNASYRRYADLKRRAAVWNVVAAPELGLALKTWCFAVVGCVGYRGYFDEAEAEALGATLRAEGLDVAVYPVPAYSTLGALPGAWFADPLLNTFLDYQDGPLARLIFHELAHQVAYANGDTLFNESFATAVERIGGARWLEAHASAETRAADARQAEQRDDFRQLMARFRAELQTLYASSESDADKRAGKTRLMAELRSEHERLKQTRWNGYTGYDRWFARANNASIGVLAAYNDAAPAFERLFEREGRDFDRFYAEVRRLAAAPRAERRAALAAGAAASAP